MCVCVCLCACVCFLCVVCVCHVGGGGGFPTKCSVFSGSMGPAVMAALVQDLTFVKSFVSCVLCVLFMVDLCFFLLLLLLFRVFRVFRLFVLFEDPFVRLLIVHFLVFFVCLLTQAFTKLE